MEEDNSIFEQICNDLRDISKQYFSSMFSPGDVILFKTGALVAERLFVFKRLKYSGLLLVQFIDDPKHSAHLKYVNMELGTFDGQTEVELPVEFHGTYIDILFHNLQAYDHASHRSVSLELYPAFVKEFYQEILQGFRKALASTFVGV